MSGTGVREALGFIGGTGPQGRGLAARWALAGPVVHLGSRSRERAQEAVDDVRGRAGDAVDVRACTNEEAAVAGEIIVLTIPHEAQTATLTPLADAIGDKIVLNCVNPMVFDEVGPLMVDLPAGSAAEESQQLLPRARIVSGFHDVSSRRLLRVREPVESDVLICGDDVEASHRVAHLAARSPGMWAVNCGPLRNSRHLEDMTAVLLFINRYYKTQAGIRIDGIERDDAAMHAHRAEGATRRGRKPRATQPAAGEAGVA